MSLNASLLAEAKALGINISKACEAGLAEQVRDIQVKKWQEENRDAIEYWNQYVAENGLPLDKYRQF